MPHEMNILALAKGKERYVFLYDDESCDTLLDLLDQYAENPDLSFTESDAAILEEKVLESHRRIRPRNAATRHDA